MVSQIKKGTHSLSLIFSSMALPAPTSATTAPADEVERRFPFFTVFKGGRVEVHLPFPPHPPVPPSPDDASLGVLSKDVMISASPCISVRIFVPVCAVTGADRLPLVFYVHGGAFCMGSATSPHYHALLSAMVGSGRLVAVSVDYGLFPDRPIPACYDDSWAALLWTAAHAGGRGPEPWLAAHADLTRVFLVGDSAGANICHTLTVRAGGPTRPPGVRVVGMVLVHPFFGGTDHDEMWLYMCPENEGPLDPRLRPGSPEMARLGCDRVLVFVAELDRLRGVAVSYYEELERSGWQGRAELVENKGEDHCFHLFDLSSEKSLEVIRRLVSFVVDDE